MRDYDVIIVGGGPAGSAAAATLALKGVGVLLLEEKRMPREKLCGEFITPECFPTLRRLGVMNSMLDAGAQKITRLSLCVSDGKQVDASVAVMSERDTWAMGLSRSKFDHLLFERARECGATCMERVAVKQALMRGSGARGVEATSLADGRTLSYNAPIVLDASGRNSRLTLMRRERRAGRHGGRLYAMKAHLEGVEAITDQVELYFFSGGYGGLSRVEGGLSNLCFIVNERTLKLCGGDPDRVLTETVMRNSIARERLAHCRAVGRWLTVGPLKFGRGGLSRNGVIAIGDAAGMIDPFTGTGLQIALRSGEIVSEAVMPALNPQSKRSSISPFENALSSYTAAYAEEFGGRMRVAGFLRRIAFHAIAANATARLFVKAPSVTRMVLKATRTG